MVRKKRQLQNDNILVETEDLPDSVKSIRKTRQRTCNKNVSNEANLNQITTKKNILNSEIEPVIKKAKVLKKFKKESCFADSPESTSSSVFGSAPTIKSEFDSNHHSDFDDSTKSSSINPNNFKARKQSKSQTYNKSSKKSSETNSKAKSKSLKPKEDTKKVSKIKPKVVKEHNLSGKNNSYRLDDSESRNRHTEEKTALQLLTHLEFKSKESELSEIKKSNSFISDNDSSSNPDWEEDEEPKRRSESSSTNLDNFKSKKQSNKPICNKSSKKSAPEINSKTKLKNLNSKKDSKKKTKVKNIQISPEKNNCFQLDNREDNNNCTKDETALQVLTRLEFGSKANEISGIKNSKSFISNNDSSSDSDWEEVEENKEQNLDDYNPIIPKDGVEITIDCPELKHKRKKKQFDQMEYIRLYINRERKEHQLNAHKTHLLCLIAHGLYVNDLLNSSTLRAYSLSVLSSGVIEMTAGRKIDKIELKGIQAIVDWFRNYFTFEVQKQPFIDLAKCLPQYFEENRSLSASEYNLLFVVIARSLGFKTRYCVSLYPLSYKAQNLLKKPGSKKSSSKKEKIEDGSASFSKKTDATTAGTSSILVEKPAKGKKMKKEIKSSNTTSTKNKKKKLDDQKNDLKSYPKRSTSKSYKMSSNESDSDDEDFIPEEEIKQTKKTQTPKAGTSKKPNRSILSSDSAPSSPENTKVPFNKIVCWSEIFCKASKHWVSVDCTQRIIDDPYAIEKLLPQPVTYILAFDNDSYVKDVTRRYCSEYMTSTVKLRIDPDWWEETLEPFAPPNSKLDKEEEKKLEETLINKPLPQTVSGYKNHPLYALKRHLLKFEAIYPPDAAPVGFLRSEPVYARENVVQLHSRETWVKEARVVRAGEEPYKIVKARPKWDRIAGVMRTDLPLEIFGFWQTDPYKPPKAVGGKVPRNEYGNVELFKPCMLPEGTVHLQIPGLNRVAKKLGIDCSPAVIGFDGHKGSIHPVFDGFVVCKEYKDTLLAAWDEEQENARKREEEKREKRIYGNWKKLIKGLLIRERIKLKYDVK